MFGPHVAHMDLTTWKLKGLNRSVNGSCMGFSIEGFVRYLQTSNKVS